MKVPAIRIPMPGPSLAETESFALSVF